MPRSNPTKISAFLNRKRGRASREYVSQNESAADLWMRRLANISQLGLLLVTAGTIYFTVLPLYQKALLEEKIAQREIELKNISESLEENYANLRSHIVGSYIFSAGASCSGLLEKHDLGSATPITPPSNSLSDKIFAINVQECLLEKLKSQKNLRNLRAEDFKLLEKRIAEIGPRLLLKREQAMKDYKMVPVIAETSPSSIPEPVGMGARYIEIIIKSNKELEGAQVSGRKLYSRNNIDDLKKKISIHQEQNRISSKYGAAIRDEISALKDIDWKNKVIK